MKSHSLVLFFGDNDVPQIFVFTLKKGQFIENMQTVNVSDMIEWRTVYNVVKESLQLSVF